MGDGFATLWEEQEQQVGGLPEMEAKTRILHPNLCG
jgi:hypothetical protein